MASKKISQLPPASIVTEGSLLPLVTNGVTEKVAISQLPTGISNLNNLGGGTSLGLISGSQLQLKTIIPGVGLFFTTTSETITIYSTLDVSNVGSGVSIINSFSNPNLALKSITGSNGISITNNTTSVNISNSIDTTLDSIIGLIEIPTIKTYKLDTYVIKPFNVTKLHILTQSGSASIRIKTQNSLGVDITNSNTFNATTTRSENIITGVTASNSQQLVLEVLSINSCLDLSFTVELTYI